MVPKYWGKYGPLNLKRGKYEPWTGGNMDRGNVGTHLISNKIYVMGTCSHLAHSNVSILFIFAENSWKE